MSEIEKKPHVPGQPHPDCIAMHALGYCVCLMVECAFCHEPRAHPSHKPHKLPVVSPPGK